MAYSSLLCLIGFLNSLWELCLSVSFSWYQHLLRNMSRVCFYVVVAYHVMIFCSPNHFANRYSEDKLLTPIEN